MVRCETCGDMGGHMKACPVCRSKEIVSTVHVVHQKTSGTRQSHAVTGSRWFQLWGEMPPTRIP